MGGSLWVDEHYTDAKTARAATKTPDFAYDAAVRSKPVAARTAHDTLNIHDKDRESCDSDAHPSSLAIAVLFDVTGSMHSIPRTLQAKLPGLMGLLLRKGYATDPQVLFGGIGDAYCDKVPLQVGQYESGVEMDSDLRNLYLEGGGGGGWQESYDLGLYYFAHHTKIDCWTKRGAKGYLFLIGDEGAYEVHDAGQIERIIGDRQPRTARLEDTIKALTERYEVFMIRPTHASNSGKGKIQDQWVKLLGEERVLTIDDPDGICETIGLAIGMCEGRIGIDDGLSDLKDTGTSAHVTRAVSTALAPLARGTSGGLAAPGALPGAKPAAAAVARL